MMKKSPIYPKHETEFDPQLDFVQFLKEARTHVNELKHETQMPPHSPEVAANKPVDEGIKNKRSWKKSLLSWLKPDMKRKPMTNGPKEQPSNNLYNISKVKHTFSSGTINRERTFNTEWPRRPNSGPLTGFFNQTKKMTEEDKVPYICLDQLNNNSPTPRVVQSYGPLYMVS